LVDPYDEEEVVESTVVIRRINPDYHLADDEDTGGKRLSSKAFSPTKKSGMSVDFEHLMLVDGVDPRKFVTTPVYTGSVWFRAGAARAAGLSVGYEPIKDDPEQPDNPYHGEVWGEPPRTDRFKGAQKRALMNAAEWYVTIPDVVIKKDED
jgi:hypothetical protein